VIAVVVSLVFPYIREHCTIYLFAHLAVASLGLVWSCHDLSKVVESTVRSGVNFALDQLILDNLLRAIYHPTYGLWASCVGTYLGASSMYGLPMSDDERTELIQSSLYLRDENQAHSVLLEPGGCKALLPEQVQNWLQQSSSSLSLHTTIDSVGMESDKSTSDYDVAEADEKDQEFRESSIAEEALEQIGESSNKVHFSEDETKERVSESGAKQETKRATGIECLNQADPVEVFFRILRNMAMQRIQSYAKAFPRSQIENLGIAAAMTLGIRLTLWRPSYNRSPLVCAGITALSFGAILSREAILGNIYNKQSMQLVCKDIASSILDKLKGKSSSKRSFFAMLALALFCRRKQGSRDIPANTQ